jgi:hypothetical protein
MMAFINNSPRSNSNSSLPFFLVICRFSPFEEANHWVLGKMPDEPFPHFIVRVDEQSDTSHYSPALPWDWAASQELIET